MPESLTTELRELQATATELASGRLSELRAKRDLDAEDDRRSLRAEVAAASKEAGLFELTRTSLDGEPAASALALAVVREALAAHDVIDLPGLFGPSPGLLASVGEPLRTTHLRPLLDGEKQAAFGFTEPDGASRHTWAVVDGDELVVTGQKSYVTGGADADFVNTLVEIDAPGDEGGPAMVVIDTDAPGVSIVRRFESLDGSHHAAIELDGVRVPRSHVVGPAGKGLSRAVDQVNGVRMSIAASCVGLTAFVARYVEEYLRAPHRSGTPLGASERHRLRFGELRIEAYAARCVLYRTARLVDAVDDPKDAINEIMACKHVTTETVGGVTDTAIQTVGGQALVAGHPLESIHRRIRTLRLAEGTSDVLALNIARGRLDLDSGRL